MNLIANNPYVVYAKWTALALLVGALLTTGWMLSKAHDNIDALKAQLVEVRKDLKDKDAQLTVLADKRDALEKALKAAQKRAAKARQNSEKEAQRILQEQWPEDCQAAADKAWDEVQRMKGTQ